ncbi:MAG: GNAT family N-acetyltransferase [Planctomycetota bacterium]
MPYRIDSMQPDQWTRVATLVHDSTNAWYQQRGFPPIFGDGPASTRLFCEVYEALDPGCCLVAQREDGVVAGSCFYHPRPTHVSLGIMNVDPQFFGQGVATLLLRAVLHESERLGRPTRLVSSALNLDSFSLYNRLGFVPHTVFQDMLLTVPAGGMGALAEQPLYGDQVRPAERRDVPALVALEEAHVGISRQQDFEFFIENRQQIWKLVVLEAAGSHEIVGFMNAVRHPASSMVGPGFARNEAEAIALLYAAFDHHAGNPAVALVPSQAQQVTQAMYGWGARNCEVHLGQIHGPLPACRGWSFPTFMPETA